MRRVESISLPIGLTKLKTDIKVIITPIDQLGIKPEEISDVAYHEAEHVAPDPRNVRWATIFPGPGYLGATLLYVRNIIQAAAPHANGRKGTGHDLGTIEAGGNDVDSAISAAGDVIRPLRRKVLHIAALLQLKGEISGYEAEEVAKKAEYDEAKIKIVGSNGKERNLVSRVRRGENHTITIGLEEEKIKKPESEIAEQTAASGENNNRPFGDKVRMIGDYQKNRLVSAEVA